MKANLVLFLCFCVLLLNGQQTSYNVSATSLFKMPLSGVSSAIGGGALTAGQCNTTTVSIPGATTGMTVSVSPTAGTSIGAGVTWFGQVTSADTVTVSECALLVVTPTSATFAVRVFQ